MLVRSCFRKIKYWMFSTFVASVHLNHPYSKTTAPVELVSKNVVIVAFLRNSFLPYQSSSMPLGDSLINNQYCKRALRRSHKNRLFKIYKCWAIFIISDLQYISRDSGWHGGQFEENFVQQRQYFTASNCERSTINYFQNKMVSIRLC